MVRQRINSGDQQWQRGFYSSANRNSLCASTSTLLFSPQLSKYISTVTCDADAKPDAIPAALAYTVKTIHQNDSETIGRSVFEAVKMKVRCHFQTTARFLCKALDYK